MHNIESLGDEVKLLQNIAGSKESLKHVADGETYIKAKFSEKAVKLFQDEMEEESQTDWQNSSTCMIILQQFRVEFEPATHLSQCQYILVVEKFKLWDLQEGFSIKNNNLMFCMNHEEVKKKAEQDWKKFREDREESMPLSELLAEMACPSLEENTELSEPDEQQSVKQHSVDYDSVEQRMDHLPDSLLKQLYSTFSFEEFHIKEEELKILSELTEWKAEYRPSPAQSSEERVEDHNYSLSGCQVSSMNTLAADNPPRGTTRGGNGNRSKQSGRSMDPRDKTGHSSTRISTPPYRCNRKQGSKAITIPGSQPSQYSNGQASQVSVYSQKHMLWVIKEPPRRDSSFEHTEQMIKLMDGKIFEDSAQWQQDLESVHLSCDESLDIGSPSAESTPVEIHYSSVRKARKSHPEDTGSCSSSLEYLGLVTQTSGVRPNKSSSDVAMGLEKKVGTDSLSEGVDEPDSQIKSDSSPSILNPIESRTNSEFKSVNQTEVQNIHLQSTLEPIVKVEVDEIREEATKQNSVLNNSECLSISCTRQLELNVNVSSSNSVISPSPEAEVSTFAPSAISGIVCGLTSQRIRKTQAVNSLCNQLVSTADETGNEHYLTALEVSIECQNLSETEPVKETARITRSKTRTWQDDDDIDKTHQADDSQQGQSCSKTKGVDNSSPLHDNAIHRTNVTVNRVVEATEDSLIRDNLQSSENEPNQNLEASLQSTSDKSLILEYYIKGQSPQKKINKDCLVERANSFMENFKVSNSSQADNRNTARSDMTDLRRKHEGSMLNIKRRSPRLSGKVNVDNTQVISNDKGKEKTSKQGKELMTDSSNEESLSEDEINNNEVSSENFSFRELASSEDSSCSEDEQLHAIVKNAEQIHISDIDAAKSSAVLSKNVPQTPDRSSKSEKRRQTNHCTQDKSLQSNKSDTSSCKNKHSDGTKNHTNDISDKAIISGCGPQDLAFSEIDRHRPIGCEKVDNNLRKIGDISMKKSSGSNNEKILDTEQSNLSLQKTPNNKVLGDKIVSNSVETGKCLNGKTNSPLQISASEDGLDNLTSEKVHAFRDPSSSREMNSDESLETEGTPDLLGGTQPFQIEHLKQKSPTETPLPDILTGTQGFNTAYSETQGFVPDLSGSLRSLSSSSNEQSSLNSSGENRGDNAKSLTQGFVPVLFSSSRSLSHSSNETSLLNSSDEKRVNQLISPDSVLERPRLNRKSKMHVRSTNSVVNNVSNQYSAELKAEELRLENLTKPCNSNVTGQFVSETVESLNITEKTSDRLVNKNQDMIIISSGSSIEEFTETEVKKKDNYKMNRAEKINSDLSERSILHKNGQDNIQTSDFNESDNTVIEPPAINSSSEGLDGNIQIQVDSLKQLLSGVRVQPVNRVIRGHSKYTGKRRKNREKDKNEPKGNVLRVKPVNNINRKGQSKQSVSGNFINLIDTESESEPEIHFDKNTKMKTYEPEKVVIDGRTFENKKKWMNFVESPFPPPRKSARKSFRIDIFDNQEKTAAVNSTAGSVGRYGLVYKKVDGVYHFDRESKEGTQYNRTSTNSTHKSSKHVAPDVKIVDTSSQSIDNLEEQQKDTNGLNNEENVSDSSSNWALKCSLGNSLNENENFTAYKQDKKIDTRHTPNNSNGKNGNKMNNKENVSKGRLNADLECSSSNSLNENENLKDCQTNANNIPKSLKPIVELRKVDQMCHSIDTLVGQEQGGSIKELNNKENISEGCSNAAVKSSLGNSLKEREILNLTTETSLFSKSNSEATRNSKTVCRKRKLNADGDGKSCKVQRLTDVAQNIKTFTGLSREMRQANITAFFKNTERKSKYMQGLDLRNSLTQEWIDKQIFEGDSENNNSHLEGTNYSAVEDEETSSKVERRTTRSRSKEIPGYLEWEKLWTSGKLEPTSDLGKKMLQLKLSSDLETAVTSLLRK